jgi:hypothetical protein
MLHQTQTNLRNTMKTNIQLMPEYDALLQEDEDECTLDCGCRMWRDGEEFAWKFCQRHALVSPWPNPLSVVAEVAADASSEIARAHVALSEALEDEDGGNDEVRSAAVDVCDALNALQVRAKGALPASEDQDECEDGVGQFLAVPKDLWGKLCCLAEGVAWSAEGASSFIREARGVCGEIDSFYGKPAPSGEVVGK